MITNNQTDNIDFQSESTNKMSVLELVLILKETFNYLLSKWLIILLFCLLGGALGFLYAYLKKPIYTASTTFVLEEGDKGGGLSSLGGIAAVTGIDLGGGGGGLFQGDNLLELYKSRTMIEKTLLSPMQEDSSKLLVDRYLSFNPIEVSIKGSSSSLKDFRQLDSLKNKRLRDSLLGEIVSNIKKSYLVVGKLDKKLSVIKVDVNSTDELFAKDFNDQIVQNVNEFYKQTKTKKSMANVKILQDKTDSVRGMMNSAIYSSVKVADATPNINPTRQVERIAPMQRSQFSAETNKAVLGTMLQNLEMSKLSVLKETPLIQTVDKPIYPLYKERFSKSKGIAIGVIISGLLSVMFLIIRRFLINLMKEGAAKS